MTGPRSRLSDPWPALMLAGSLLVILLAGLLNHTGGRRLQLFGWTLPETCASRIWLGADCPGCGLTRSVVSLAHGDVVQSWRYHAAGAPLLLLILAQAPIRAWQCWRQARGVAPRPLPGAVYWPLALAVLILVSWCWRLLG